MNVRVQPQPDLTLSDKFETLDGQIYLTGPQALIRLMIDQNRADRGAGLNTAGFVCGYPGSPLGGLDMEMVRYKSFLDENHVVHKLGLNEDLAATAAFGTQMLHHVSGAKYDGVYAMWFGKAPGVDRSSDALRHANFRGVGRNGGALAIAGDDPFATSSMIPSDSNAAFFDFQMPIVTPGNIQDVIDLGLHGYAMSRASGLWVGMKLPTSIADSAGIAFVGPDRISPKMPTVELDGKPYTPQISLNEAGAMMCENERQLYHGRIELARQYGLLNGLNPVTVSPKDARIGIVSTGKTYYDLRQALRDIGLGDRELETRGIRILKVNMPYPMAKETILDFADGLSDIIIVEEKRPFIETFFRECLYDLKDRPAIHGKSEASGAPLFPVHGELNPSLVAKGLFQVLRAFEGMNLTFPNDRQGASTPDLGVMPMRGAYFCSGCPHNSSLPASADSIVGAGIGCHVMALYMGRERFGDVLGFTQMGGEGAQWIGLEPFADTAHFVQNLGDGTFMHSGSLAVRFAVASGANMTYKLLYNRAVAMVGGQPVMGELDVPSLTRLFAAEGVARVVVTTEDPDRYRGLDLAPGATVRHRDEVLDVQRELRQVKGVTVMIHDQQCAAEKRRLRKRGKVETPKRAVLINERVCEGCGDCGVKSNCLSVQPVDTEFGRKTRIHQNSCNQDFSCLKGDCPSFMTVELSPKDIEKAKTPLSLPDLDLAAPRQPDVTGSYGVLMVGIGGTGVVTINQILATAAAIDGWDVKGMDVTGVSQKAGPVMSELRLIRESGDYAAGLSDGGTDLLLGFDELGSVMPKNLAKLDPARTAAVVSTSRTPTGRMVAHKSEHYPERDQIRSILSRYIEADRGLEVDAQNLAKEFIGDQMAGNLVVLGAAIERGLMPVSLGAIEQAIRLNGASVDANLKALKLGRLAVAAPEALSSADPDSVAATKTPSQRAQGSAGTITQDSRLRDLIALRYDELVAFQNKAYADRYVSDLDRVRRAEAALQGTSTSLTETVARNLYKVMAYKDEYETARLMLDFAPEPDALARAKYRWHLHPTFVRALGRKKKLELGAWFRPVLGVIRTMKFLRGTSFDVFGTTYVRRAERKLVDDYRAILDALVANLSDKTHDMAVKVAAMPDTVRGYESVKVRNLDRFYRDTARALYDMKIDLKLHRLPRKGHTFVAQSGAPMKWRSV